MIYSKEVYAKNRLKQAYEAINDADDLLKTGRTMSAIALSFQAARFAAEAALVGTGNDSVKADSILFLTAGFVKTGQLSEKSYNAFRTLMDLSIYATERDFSLVKSSEANAAISNIKVFIREISDIVKKITGA